jgi:DNA-binding IclR family transcriptional regulator
MGILDGLLDEKIYRVISLFLKNPGQLYHLNKVSEDSGVPLATTFRIMKSLHSNKYISITKISKLKLYSLAENSATKQLRRLL